MAIEAIPSYRGFFSQCPRKTPKERDDQPCNISNFPEQHREHGRVFAFSDRFPKRHLPLSLLNFFRLAKSEIRVKMKAIPRTI